VVVKALAAGHCDELAPLHVDLGVRSTQVKASQCKSMQADVSAGNGKSFCKAHQQTLQDVQEVNDTALE
jgi:hypothetical protein